MGALTLASLALASGGSAAADGEFRLPGLVSPGTTSIALPRADGAAPVRLCNTKDFRVDVHAEVTGSSANATSVQIADLTLDAGGCQDVVFTLDEAAVADAAKKGGATGSVLFVSNGAGSLSIPFTLGGAPAEVDAEQVLGEAEFHATTDDRTVDLEDADLALLYPSGEASLPKAKDWTLADGGRTLLVRPNFTRQVGDVRTYRLEARESAAEVEPGTYEGVIAFGGDKGDVPVTVEVDDPFRLLVVILLFGIVIGLALKVLVERTRLQVRLGRERDKVRGSYGLLGGDWGTKFLPPTPETFDAFEADNRAAEAAYTRTVLAIDTGNADFAKVVSAVKDAKADAAFFGDGLVDALEALKSTRDDVVTWLDLRLPDFESPAVLDARTGASSVLRDVPAGDLTLAIGQARKLGDRADALRDVLDAWLEVAERLVRLAQWAMALETDNASVQLTEAKGLLGRAAHDLWEATDLESIEKVADGDALGDAQERLTVLGSAAGIWPRRRSVTQTDSWAGIEPPITNARLLLLDGGDQEDVEATTFGPDHVDHGYAIELARRSTDYLPLVVAGVLALVASVIATKLAVYDAEDFASRGTVLAVLLAGVGATATLDALAKAVSWAVGGLSALVKT